MLEEFLCTVEGERSKLGVDYSALVHTLDRATGALPNDSSPAVRRAQTELIDTATRLEKALARRSEREKELSSVEHSIDRAAMRKDSLEADLAQISSALALARDEKEQADDERLLALAKTEFATVEEQIEHEQEKVSDARKKATKLKGLQGEAPNLRKKVTQTRQERHKAEKNCERLADEIVRLEQDLVDKAKVLIELKDEAKAKTCDTQQSVWPPVPRPNSGWEADIGA